jgi:pyruvate/2-oxoglutarate dehydrogenase complex dihydrolipoamide acyltransferase (E2) component
MRSPVLVLEWLRAPGSPVKLNDPLILVETDKTNAEIPSPVDGTLVEQLVAVNDEINPGTPVCIIDDAVD